jgi:hypothetical protein
MCSAGAVGKMVRLVPPVHVATGDGVWRHDEVPPPERAFALGSPFPSAARPPQERASHRLAPHVQTGKGARRDGTTQRYPGTTTHSVTGVVVLA